MLTGTSRGLEKEDAGNVSEGREPRLCSHNPS